MIISAVNRYMEGREGKTETEPDASSKKTTQKQNGVPFDDNDIQAITDTLSMFRKR